MNGTTPAEGENDGTLLSLIRENDVLFLVCALAPYLLRTVWDYLGPLAMCSRADGPQGRKGPRGQAPWAPNRLPRGKKYHFFICHHQASGGDQAGRLCDRLKNRGFAVWHDDSVDLVERDLKGMRKGVRESVCLLLFWSGRTEEGGYQGLFTRPFCHWEMQEAHKAGLRCIGIMEDDVRHGKPDFAQEPARARECVPGKGVETCVMEQNLKLLAPETALTFHPYRRDHRELDTLLNRIGECLSDQRCYILPRPKTLSQEQEVAMSIESNDVFTLQQASERPVWVSDDAPFRCGVSSGNKDADGKLLVKPQKGWAKQWVKVQRISTLSRGSFYVGEGATGRYAEYDGTESAKTWKTVVFEPPGYTMGNVVSPGANWAEAVKTSGMTPKEAHRLACARLCFWHLAQPALYLLLFAVYAPELGAGGTWTTRHGFLCGVGVAVREAIYLLSTLTCVWVNPSFLLVDVAASVRDTLAKRGQKGPIFLAMYVLAPEKFVAIALFGWGAGGQRQRIGSVFMLLSPLLDLCGVGALGAGIGSGFLPAPLCVGYTVTAIGAFVMVFIVAFEKSRHPDDFTACDLQLSAKTTALVVALVQLIICVLPAFLIPMWLGMGDNSLSHWQWLMIVSPVLLLAIAVAVVASQPVPEKTRTIAPTASVEDVATMSRESHLIWGESLNSPLLTRLSSAEVGGSE